MRDQSWQRVKKNSVPFGVVLKWSVTWLLNVEPSDPFPRAVKVNVPFTALPFALKPPQTVNFPV